MGFRATASKQLGNADNFSGSQLVNDEKRASGQDADFSVASFTVAEASGGGEVSGERNPPNGIAKDIGTAVSRDCVLAAVVKPSPAETLSGVPPFPGHLR